MVSNGIKPFNPSLKQLKIVDANYDNAKMNNKDFLKVLLESLRWQDPLQAQDISTFINNTIKLRQMEVLNDFQSTIKLLKTVNQTNILLYASGLINKKVFYEGTQTYVQNGQSKVSFKLNDDADIVHISVLDSKGNVVESKTFQHLKKLKEYPFQINNPNLQDGYYTVHIDAKKGSQNVKSTVYSTGVVNSIRKDGSNIYVFIGNQKIDFNKINQIGG